MRGSEGDWGREYDTDDNIFLRLLGIHAGQYPETVKARKVIEAKSEGADDHLRHGDEFSIEGGTTIVVPAWEVRDLLNRSIFVERREKRISEE